jgi:hypothetical protein
MEFQTATSTRIALYSIDCVRKLLINHRCFDPIVFDRLDEARAAEMKHEDDFWSKHEQVGSTGDRTLARVQVQSIDDVTKYEPITTMDYNERRQRSHFSFDLH